MEVLHAQGALSRLIELDLPVKVSLDIALISNTVDVQAKAFGLVRDRLFKTYSIKTEAGDLEGSVSFLCIEEIEVLDKEAKERHGVSWLDLRKLDNGRKLQNQMVADIPEVARVVKKQQENLEAFGDKFNSLLEAKTEDLIFKKIQLPLEINGKPLEVKPSILKALTEFVEVV